MYGWGEVKALSSSFFFFFLANVKSNHSVYVSCPPLFVSKTFASASPKKIDDGQYRNRKTGSRSALVNSSSMAADTVACSEGPPLGSSTRLRVPNIVHTNGRPSNKKRGADKRNLPPTGNSSRKNLSSNQEWRTARTNHSRLEANNGCS